MTKKLGVNRENFCNYYIETGNASEAYRMAYPGSAGWKDGVVKKRASELLRHPGVASRVDELQSEAREKSDMKKEDALRFLASVVNVDPVDLYNEDGGTFIAKSINDIPEPVRRCILSVKNTKDGVEIRLYNKIAAIAQISKMLGWDAPVKSDVKTNVRMIIGDE